MRQTPITPDPWGHDIERQLDDPDTMEVCHRCATPQDPGAWFCPHCGIAVGPYNNLMPWVLAFSEGEVFRNGATDKFRVNALTMVGYFLYSLASYMMFAPVFWYFLIRNVRNQREKEAASFSIEES